MNNYASNNIEVFLKQIAMQGTGEGGGVVIDDSNASNDTTYSSSKINTELGKKSGTSHTHTATTLAVDIDGLNATNLEDALKELLSLIPQGE